MNPYALKFYDMGVGIFPIITPGKEPACKSWDDYRCTREQASRFKNFGVRLTVALGVVDTDSPESEAWVKASGIPETTFKVQTARGLHRYYRLRSEATPKFIKRDGLTIEFRNAGQYVVGPGSLHQSGHVYAPVFDQLTWHWSLTDLPIFPADFNFGGDAGRQIEGDGLAYQMPEVQAGERHDALYKLLRSLKALGNAKEVVWEMVQLANENFCQPPLKNNSEFKRWFDRGFDGQDRPIERILPKNFASLGVDDV